MAIPVLCPCCQLRTLQQFALSNDGRRVCEACRTDQHRSVQGRDDVHGWLWRNYCKRLEESAKQANVRANSLAASARDQADAAVAGEMEGLRSQISEMRTRVSEVEAENTRLKEQIALDYEDDISEKLKEHVETAALAHAKNEKDRAYSRENEVLAILLLDIEPQHRGKRGPVSKCTCGKLTAECPEWQAIEPLRDQLPHWERQQIKRMSEGRPFGLPRRHPEVRKVHGNTPRWDFKGLPMQIARLDKDIPMSERRAG